MSYRFLNYFEPVFVDSFAILDLENQEELSIIIRSTLFEHLNILYVNRERLRQDFQMREMAIDQTGSSIFNSMETYLLDMEPNLCVEYLQAYLLFLGSKFGSKTIEKFILGNMAIISGVFRRLSNITSSTLEELFKQLISYLKKESSLP